MCTVEKSTNCCLERLRMVFVIGTLDKYDDQEEVRPILRLSLLESACCRSGCSVGDQLNNWPADELSLTHNWANTHRESREGEEPFSSTRTQEEKEEYLSLEEDSSLFHSLSTFSPYYLSSYSSLYLDSVGVARGMLQLHFFCTVARSCLRCALIAWGNEGRGIFSKKV